MILCRSRTLRRKQRELGIAGPRAAFWSSDFATCKEWVLEEMALDPECWRGPSSIQDIILHRTRVRVPRCVVASLVRRTLYYLNQLVRDLVRAIMLEENEEGFELRRRRRRPINRYVLYAAGPFDAGHADGYEKLAALLFPIYLIKDRSSKLCVYFDTKPNVRKKLHIRLTYLEHIEQMQGTLCSDKRANRIKC